MSRIQDEIEVLKEKVNDLAVKEGGNSEKLANIEASLIEIKGKFSEYTTLEKFTPVQLVVFGMVSAILLMFMGGVGMYVFHADPANITNITPIIGPLKPGQ